MGLFSGTTFTKNNKFKPFHPGKVPGFLGEGQIQFKQQGRPAPLVGDDVKDLMSHKFSKDQGIQLHPPKFNLHHPKLSKTNMKPENDGLQKECPLPVVHVQVSCQFSGVQPPEKGSMLGGKIRLPTYLFFRGYAKFLMCNSLTLQHLLSRYCRF